MTDLLLQIAIAAIPVIFAITLHEAAHGYAALALGDDTARSMGRLSLNPLRHVDRVGTLLLPGNRSDVRERSTTVAMHLLRSVLRPSEDAG